MKKNVWTPYLASTLAGLGALGIFGSQIYIAQLEHDVTTPHTSTSAPAPDHTFENVSCAAPSPASLAPKHRIASNSWFSPELGVGSKINVSDTLPPADTNDGIIYAPGEELGSEQGTSLLAGHVDFAPGIKSEEGGELTAWGNLHKLSPCSIIFTADSNGDISAHQVVTKLVEPQRDPDLESYVIEHPEDRQAQQRLQRQQKIDEKLFRSTGSPTTVWLTCSGESVEDVGGQFQFRYANNLIIETIPV